MNWRSTTLRFAALVFLLQILAALALILTLGVTLRDQVSRNVEETSDILREDLLAIYARGGKAALQQAVDIRTTRLITPDAVLLLADGQAQRLSGNLPHWPATVPIDGSRVTLSLYRQGALSPESMRVRATQLPDGTKLLTGVVVQGEQRVLALFEGASLLALCLALLFAALAALLATRLITARLLSTAETLGAVRDGDLTRRVPEDDTRDAFAALGHAVNETLDRIDRLVSELQIATDALAHDLKSPLTRLRSSLEWTAAHVREPVAQDAIERSLAEGERLLAIVETALRISRAEAGIGKESFAPADLTAILKDIAEIYAPLAEEQGRMIEVEPAPPCVMPVQRELLAQAIGNLIDNALKYGAGPVSLSLAPAGQEVLLQVADRGQGIAEDRREEAMRRFGRLDEARSKSGAGLGLSLVSAVARLHGGALSLQDADPGLIATIRLHRNAG